MRIKIEKNIPIPPARGTDNGALTYNELLAQMDVGDSFLLKGCRDTAVARGRLGTALKKQDVGVTMRKLKDGVRVWRTR